MLVIDRTVSTDSRLPLSDRELRIILEGLLDVYGFQGAEVALRLVSDREMAELNQDYMGCLGPTNILSFPSGNISSDGSEDRHQLGDLVLSAETIAREAFIYNQNFFDYSVRLLAHGMLHLIGYDHGPEMDALTDLAVETLSPQKSPTLFASF